MAATASIRVVKQFTYRSALREFSNRYHFDNNAPADQTKWTTLSDAIVNAEKLIYLPFASKGAKIIATVGYDAGSEIPVFNKTYTTDGTGAPTNWAMTPGDVAEMVRYSTNARSSKNHPVYLFNYYHSFGIQSNSASADSCNSDQKALLGTYAAAWITGFSDGSVTHHRCGPDGDLATGHLENVYLTHRDLPR